MAAMMELFSVELDDFVKDYDDLHWDVSFRGEEYPPRIIMEQATPPLYKIEDDGSKTLEPQPTIQIIGRPETSVITTGKLSISGADKTGQPRRQPAGAVPPRVYAGAKGNGGGKC